MMTVIDYGAGNLQSISNALAFLKIEHVITRNFEDIHSAEKLILPGVGSFGHAMDKLHSYKLVDVLEEGVLDKGKPILGVCLGMQLFADKSYEGGEHKGLGWIKADVIKIEPTNKEIKIPHIGWNETKVDKLSALFAEFPDTADFYYVHGYHMVCDDSDVVARCNHGEEIVSAVNKNNIYGTQFHPEKSQDAGLAVLKNFSEI